MAAAWPRSISRKCACKIPKGNMGYDQYTVCNDCSCQTYFLLLSFVLANIWRYVRVSFTLGARDFSSAVSGFCQVFIVTRAKRFFSRLRPSANTENSRRTREKPLVPRVCVILSNFFEEQCSQSHPQLLSWLSRALFSTTFLAIALAITDLTKL